MCGICGIFDINGLGESNIAAMTAVMDHRGPDHQGIYRDKFVHLGHRRLSIIDLSETAMQPMCNETGSIWIVFNGEIYNFRELMKTLEKKGHHFKSRSDTEVILHAYEEWGENAWSMFNGMFAFGLWDSRRRALYLVRDRVGEKPVFYCFCGTKVIFASEVRSIMKEIDDRRLNIHALSDYLSLGYILSPHSILKDVQKVLPGYYVCFKDGRAESIQYWDLAQAFNSLDASREEKDVIDELHYLTEDSVKLRLESDVPLGAFLSGGLDSSSMVYWLKRFIPDSLKTFSIGFTDKSYDESDYARLASSHLGTAHAYKMIDAVNPDYLESMAYLNDEPFGDTSYVPMHILSQFARESVKVVHSGDGADELFCGYETYVADRLFGLYSSVPHFLQYPVELLVDGLPVNKGKVSLDYKLKQFIRGCKMDRLSAHYYWRVIFNEEEKAKVLNTDVAKAIGEYRPVDRFKLYYNEITSKDYISAMQYVDIKTWLVDDILTKVDRSSMAYSLESRVPFLDYRIVELTARVPTSMKMKLLSKKRLLKKMIRGKIPERIIFRKKSGFNSPVSVWFDTALKNYVNEKLSEGSLERSNIFNHKYIRHLLAEHYTNRRDNGLKLFALLNFVLWHERSCVTM